MANQNTQILTRVAGDLGQPVGFVFEGQDLTGYTVTMNIKYREPAIPRFMSINGTIDPVDSTRVIFEFTSGDLTEGQADFDFKITPPSGAYWTEPENEPLLMVVRRSTT